MKKLFFSIIFSILSFVLIFILVPFYTIDVEDNYISNDKQNYINESKSTAYTNRNVFSSNFNSSDTRYPTHSDGNEVTIEVLGTNYDSVFLHVSSSTNIFSDGIYSYSLNDSNYLNYYDNDKVNKIDSRQIKAYGDEWLYLWSYTNDLNYKEYYSDLYFQKKDDLNLLPIDINGQEYAFPGIPEHNGLLNDNKYYEYENIECPSKDTNCPKKIYSEYKDSYYRAPFNKDSNSFIDNTIDPEKNYYYILPQAWNKETNISSDYIKIYIDSSDGVPSDSSDPYESNNLYLKREIDGQEYFFKIKCEKVKLPSEVDGKTDLYISEGFKYIKDGTYTDTPPSFDDYTSYDFKEIDDLQHSSSKDNLVKMDSVDTYSGDTYSQIDPNYYIENKRSNRFYDLSSENNFDYIVEFSNLYSTSKNDSDYSNGRFYITNSNKEYNYNNYGYYNNSTPQDYFLYEVNDPSNKIVMKEKSVGDNSPIDSWNLEIDSDEISFSLNPYINDENYFQNSELKWSAFYIPDSEIKKFSNSKKAYSDFETLVDSILSLNSTIDSQNKFNSENGFGTLSVSLKSKIWKSSSNEDLLIENPFLDGIVFINPKIDQVYNSRNNDLQGIYDNDFYYYSTYNGSNDYLNSIYSNDNSNNEWLVWILIFVPIALILIITIYILSKRNRSSKLTNNKKLVRKVWK